MEKDLQILSSHIIPIPNHILHAKSPVSLLPFYFFLLP